MIPVKEFHLVHATTRDNLEQILNGGSLLSISKAKNNYSQFYEEDEIDVNKYREKIFTGLIMPDKKGKPNFTAENATSNWGYLILDPQIIEDYAQCSLTKTGGNEISFPHFCNKWNWGSNKGCIKYDTTKSLKNNLNTWRKAYLDILKEEEEEWEEVKEEYEDGEDFSPYNFTIFRTPFNEVTIQFSKNNEGECIESEIPLDKYLQAIYVYEDEDEEDEIKELANKYPQYNWIFG